MKTKSKKESEIKYILLIFRITSFEKYQGNLGLVKTFLKSFEDEKIKILSRVYNKKLQSRLINRSPNSQSFYITNKLELIKN